MKNEIKEIQIEDGIKVYAVIDLEGEEIGRFSFRPTDSRFPQRFKEVSEALSNCLPEDGAISIDEAMKKADQTIREQFDYLLGAPVSDDLFNKYRPLSTLENGDLFSCYLLERIAEVIESEIEAATEAGRK